MTKEIHQYVRNNRRDPIGVLMAVKDDKGVVRIGWSKCNTKLDKFNREVGFLIAIGRASQGSVVNLPQEVAEDYKEFCVRVSKYFKVAIDQVECNKEFVR